MPSTRSLKGKTALVTGSTSGIGQGIARALANAGANIVLNGFGDPVEIGQLVRDLAAQFDVDVRFGAADLCNPRQVREMVAEAELTCGAVDILVNNAGMQYVAPLESFPDEKWDAIIALNLSAAFHATKAALPGMRTRRFGRIINLASAHGLIASPLKCAYIAAKHGLVGLTKVTALETARDGITCNAICPGFVHTPLVEAQIESQIRATGLSRERVVDTILSKHATKEFVQVEEIAALVVFLSSTVGASTTGAALPIDGGWTAG